MYVCMYVCMYVLYIYIYIGMYVCTHAYMYRHRCNTEGLKLGGGELGLRWLVRERGYNKA